MDNIGGCLAALLWCFGIALLIVFGWAIIFGLVVVPTYTALGLHAGLKYLATNCFIGLDKLFYPGFDTPVLATWGFWGLVVGTVIQGCREMRIYGRKGIAALIALAPLLLLTFTGIVKGVNVPKPPTPKPTPTVEQNISKSETKPIARVKPTPAATKQSTTDTERKSTARLEPIQVTTKRETVPPVPSKPRKPERTTTRQNTDITTTTTPKTSTPSVPLGMVLIPTGEFQMGSGESDDEQPVHTVYIDSFYMDKYEVTNAQYKAFVNANPKWRKDQILSVYHDGDYLKHWNGNNYPSGEGEHPVTYVSWYAAMAYANWTGKRLPTEAEWEKAARGGLIAKKYPWGNSIDSTKANYNKNIGDTTPIGQYSPNAYGLYDMSGNVAEWCLDAYNQDFYKDASRQNPIADASVLSVTTNFSKVSTGPRVLRGGSWSQLSQYVRVADRTKGAPTLSYFGAGFRCVKVISR